MGVDISMFSQKSKLKLVADRAWVFTHWDSDSDYYEELYEAIYDHERGLDSLRTLHYLDLCERGHMANYGEAEDKGRLAYARHWLDAARKFVLAHPDDTFFLVNDNSDTYFDICDDYEEFFPKEKT